MGYEHTSITGCFRRSFLLAWGARDHCAAQPAATVAGDTGTLIRTLLREELTSHWYPHAVDREHGGFHQNFARDWSAHPDDNRFLVYQARMAWTAAAYAEFEEQSAMSILATPGMASRFLTR